MVLGVSSNHSFAEGMFVPAISYFFYTHED
jgi:hypothetical protein